ncbi:MAG: GNAT family N-acetyltransferase [Oscillospiraceae bacterium]|nr:GNAT family N-acetyltransferase [Oscillospiraceae bacterium]
MIVRCGRKDENRILNYIGTDYPFCLYLFLNLKKYGLDSERMEVYLQQEGEAITAVLLQYYSCLHLFARDDSFDAAELASFFREKGCSMLYCTAATARRVYRSFPETFAGRAEVTTGWVAQIRRLDKAPKGLAQPASSADFEQIAKLIFDDAEIGKSYKFEDLARQLRERSREGYSRNLVIKRDGLVIAHACTNAEMENIAVVAELIVREDCRRKGYASEIWRDLCGRLLAEGENVYSFYFSEESRALHKRLGFFEVCEWAKIVIV